MKKRYIQYHRAPLADYQTALLDDPARFTICEASTKSGKTSSHVIWLLEESLKCKPNQMVWWCSPLYGQSEIAFRRMINQVSDRKFFRINYTKLRLTLPSGALIDFKSADDVDSLYGEGCQAVVLDEFTRCRPEAFQALRSTLTQTRGRMKLIGNVKGKKGFWYQLARKAESKSDPAYSYHRITAYDAVRAGILTAEEIEQASRDLPEHIFKALYLAESTDDNSNPFGESFIHARVKPLSTLPVSVYGIDLAKSYDYTVIMGLDSNGDIAFFERFQKDWFQTENRIIEIVGRTPALIDSTGVGDSVVESIQKKCGGVEGFKFSQQSKQKLMEGLALAIQKGKTSVLEGVHKNELESFEFSYSSSGTKYSAPAGLNDDTVCAHALAVKKLYSGGDGIYHVY